MSGRLVGATDAQIERDLALLERARVVGVLDAACEKGGYWKVESDPDRLGGWQFVCLIHTDPAKGLRRYSGFTADDARLFCAKAIEAGEV